MHTYKYTESKVLFTNNLVWVKAFYHLPTQLLLKVVPIGM